MGISFKSVSLLAKYLVSFMEKESMLFVAKLLYWKGITS